MANEQIPEGWYPDPYYPDSKVRYWDGQSWTAHVLDITKPFVPASLGSPAEPQPGDFGALQQETPILQPGASGVTSDVTYGATYGATSDAAYGAAHGVGNPANAGFDEVYWTPGTNRQGGARTSEQQQQWLQSQQQQWQQQQQQQQQQNQNWQYGQQGQESGQQNWQYGQNGGTVGYQQPTQNSGSVKPLETKDKSSTWLGVGILSCFFLLWPLGIPQIVFAYRAGQAYSKGDQDNYSRNARNSSTCLIVNLCLTPLFYACLMLSYMGYMTS